MAALLSEVVSAQLEWAAWTEEQTIELSAPQQSRLLAWVAQTAAARRAYVPTATAPYARVRIRLRHGAEEEMFLDPVGVSLLGGAFRTSDEEQQEGLEILREVTRTPADVILPWR